MTARLSWLVVIAAILGMGSIPPQGYAAEVRITITVSANNVTIVVDPPTATLVEKTSLGPKTNVDLVDDGDIIVWNTRTGPGGAGVGARKVEKIQISVTNDPKGDLFFNPKEGPLIPVLLTEPGGKVVRGVPVESFNKEVGLGQAIKSPRVRSTKRTRQYNYIVRFVNRENHDARPQEKRAIRQFGRQSLQSQPGNRHSTLVDLKGGFIRDDEFAKAIRDALTNRDMPAILNAIFLFQPCFSGGMLDDLDREIVRAFPWVGGSSATHFQISWGQAKQDELAKKLTQELENRVNEVKQVQKVIKEEIEQLQAELKKNPQRRELQVRIRNLAKEISAIARFLPFVENQLRQGRAIAGGIARFNQFVAPKPHGIWTSELLPGLRNKERLGGCQVFS